MRYGNSSRPAASNDFARIRSMPDLRQGFVCGTVRLCLARRPRACTLVGALHSSSSVRGSLNLCGSFGWGSNIFSDPDPTHLIFAV
jgi:hypothetical protein